jgi:hypothetical protein
MDSPVLKFKKTYAVSIVCEEGKFFIGFGLYDTGCYPVTLTAHLTGQPNPSFTKQVINFNSGD